MDALTEQIAAGGRPSFSDFVERFGGLVPSLRELESTPQDAIWHAEGDVATHTSMVLEVAYDELRGRAAPAAECSSMAFGAVFHDVAKAFTTKEAEIDGQTRIVAPLHPEKGRSLIAWNSLDWGIPGRLRREMLAIVGHHHDPRKLYARDAGIHAWRRLAELADVRKLYWFARADLLGRRCPDLDEQLEVIELFRAGLEEFDLWDCEDPWADWREQLGEQWAGESELFRRAALGIALTDARRGVTSVAEEAVARSFRLRDGFSHLVVLCGPSGSGKSTWVAEHLSDYEVVSLDDLREDLTGNAADQSANGQVRQAAQDQLRAALAAHRNVVWDATNLRRDFRRVPIGLGRDYGAFTTLAVLDESPSACRKRNRERSRSVPDYVIDRQFERAEYPYADEADEVVFISR